MLRTIALFSFVGAIFLLPVSGRAQASKNTKKSRLTWKKYHHFCGLENGDRLDNFEQFKNKEVVWHGEVAEIKFDSILKGSDLFADRIIRLKMDPSDSLKADVKLKLQKGLNDTIDKVKEGMKVMFRGKIKFLGNFSQDHVIEVSKIGPYKPKKKRPQ